MANLARSLRAGATFLAAASAAFGATAASAQTLWSSAASGFSSSKSAAILGGAPSALEAILSQQGVAPKASGGDLRPASYSAPVSVATFSRYVATDDVTSGTPDVFGTVALKVGHTKLDRRWSAVRNARVQGQAKLFAAGLTSMAERERIERINRFVNDAVTFADDRARYGRPDVWTSASETLRSGRGDCEDYAIAKYQMMRAAGFADRDLYLVIVKDLVRRQDHAVLVVRAQDQFLLLDNGTDEVLETRQVRDYRPVLTFAASGAWTHGYRVNRKPEMTIASVESLLPANGKENEDQRSRSASLLAFNTGFNK